MKKFTALIISVFALITLLVGCSKVEGDNVPDYVNKGVRAWEKVTFVKDYDGYDYSDIKRSYELKGDTIHVYLYGGSMPAIIDNYINGDNIEPIFAAWLFSNTSTGLLRFIQEETSAYRKKTRSSDIVSVEEGTIYYFDETPAANKSNWKIRMKLWGGIEVAGARSTYETEPETTPTTEAYVEETTAEAYTEETTTEYVAEETVEESSEYAYETEAGWYENQENENEEDFSDWYNRYVPVFCAGMKDVANRYPQIGCAYYSDPGDPDDDYEFVIYVAGQGTNDPGFVSIDQDKASVENFAYDLYNAVLDHGMDTFERVNGIKVYFYYGVDSGVNDYIAVSTYNKFN